MKLSGEEETYFEVVSDLRRRKNLAWIRETRLWSLGPKVTTRKFTDTPSLQFVVREKRPRADLERSLRIPKSIAGFPTDVLSASGEIEAPPVTIPTSTTVVQAGAGIVTASGEVGTVGCLGERDGQRVLLTAGHVLDAAQVRVSTLAPPRTLLGHSFGLSKTATGADLYGLGGDHANLRFLVDLGQVLLQPSVSHLGGLPGGATFELLRDSFRDSLSLEKRAAVTCSPLAPPKPKIGWSRGLVFGRLPTFPNRDLYAYCLIQQEIPSIKGHSGRLWLAWRDHQLIALGLHFGRADRTQGRVALISDLVAGARLAGLSGIMATP